MPSSAKIWCCAIHSKDSSNTSSVWARIRFLSPGPQRRAIIVLQTTLPTFRLGWPPHERLEQLGPMIEMRASRDLSRRHLENKFQLYRGAKPQAGDPDHDPAGIFVRSEDVLQ
jgi:hypothetical protein